MSKLRLEDISDLRAYEREREAFRQRIIDLKRVRRIPVGPHLSVVFENADTIRFQIQEMARVERILSDDAIQAELDAYNPLIPDRGELCATLFIELTSKEELMGWLPKLVGIERSVVLRLGDGTEARAAPERSHEAQLTREEVTAAVHYVHFRLDEAQVKAFEAGPVTLATDHPSYRQETPLSDATRASLLADLRGDPAP